MHILVIKFKRNIIPLLFLAFTLGLLIFSKANLPAVKNGLQLFATSVIPSLFPFFVATELLMHTNIVNCIGNLFNSFMKPLFNISGKGAFALVMGIISGYPVGAKIAANFRQNNICSKEECERLLSFTNNSGPLFIIGTVGIGMYGNSTIGLLLFITHLLASFTVGFIFRFWKHKKNDNYNTAKSENSSNMQNAKMVNFYNLGEVMAESITNSTSTILMIGGFIVLFSSIISILNASGITNIITFALSPIFTTLNIDTSFIQGIFTGLLEITNGINIISGIHIKGISINIILTAFFLGFGGISILLQVLSIISKTDLSAKPYIIGKILHGLIASIYTYFFISFLPFFNFNL
ncbi:MAG: sporulation integral membrane protein YlbJ [Clostridia bacterium]|nr:sporulation integral membrane protein YlbJ [Clostridia bacterium]